MGLLSSLPLPWITSFVLLLLLIVVYIVNSMKTKRLEGIISAKQEVINHQEQIILSLEESLKNAEIKRKHDEVARSITDDALRERMQSEGYYRD